MRLSFSESDIDPRTQLSPAVNQAAADHIAEQERAVGWVDPDKTRVVPASELAAWRSIATSAPADRSAEAKQSTKPAEGSARHAEGSARHAEGNATKDDAEKEDEKEQKTFLGLNLHQVVGGVLASTTAAILGGQLGVAGTVVGAAMTTGIITIGGAIYTHGLNKTASRVGAVAGRFRLGGTTPLKNVPDVSADSTEAIGATDQIDGREHGKPGPTKGRSWRDKISPVKLLATAAAIFLLAAVVVTGLEALRGESFSGGGQTTVGQISERSSSSSITDSNAGTTEPQREARPAAEPTPGPATPAPTPTSEPTPTPGAAEPTPPASGSGDGSTSSGSNSGGGTDGADSGTDAPAGGSADSGASRSDSAQANSDSAPGQ